jgi:hypothetical protein
MKLLNEQFARMQRLAGLITESEYKTKLTENTFYQDMVTANPGWDRETVMDMVKDEYEKEGSMGDIDVSGDYEDHLEYLKGAEEWFDKRQSAGPTVKPGDKVEVLDMMTRKFIPGVIESETMLKGKFMFAGSIEPNKIPGWIIKTKLGVTAVPQWKEGMMFKKIG